MHEEARGELWETRGEQPGDVTPERRADDERAPHAQSSELEDAPVDAPREREDLLSRVVAVARHVDGDRVEPERAQREDLGPVPAPWFPSRRGPGEKKTPAAGGGTGAA